MRRCVAVLAARDMPAERRRAAALDRRHHLQLAEAHMAGVGSDATPVRGRGRYPRPPELAAPREPRSRRAALAASVTAVARAGS